MFIADSRRPGGAGIWPLQHDDHIRQGIDLDMRTGIVAVRIQRRLDDIEHVGRYLYDPETVGDVNGGMFWPRDTRSIGSWQFAFPAVMAKKSTNQDSNINTPRGVTATQGLGGNVAPPPTDDPAMLPLRDEMLKDGTFKTLEPIIPMVNGKAIWPKFPKGFIGIGMKAVNTEKQIDYFLPTDPRLISVNAASDPDYSSIVADLDGDGNIDPERLARLHSFWWVIKKPTGGYQFPDRNFLAWNIGVSGQDTVRGGFVIDFPNGGNGGTVAGNDRCIGAVATRLSGPFDVGGFGDKHQLGKDKDGHEVNSLHFSTDAYFRMRADRDAPLFFENEIYREPPQKSSRARVHLVYDENADHAFVLGPQKGMWKWYAECDTYTITKKTEYPPIPLEPVPIRVPVPTPGGIPWESTEGGVQFWGLNPFNPPLLPPIGTPYDLNNARGPQLISGTPNRPATPTPNSSNVQGSNLTPGQPLSPTQSTEPGSIYNRDEVDRLTGGTDIFGNPITTNRDMGVPGTPENPFTSATPNPAATATPVMSQQWADNMQWLALLEMLTITGNTYRPPDYTPGAPDTRGVPANNDVATVDNTRRKTDANNPVVGSQAAFGQQGGQTGTTTGKFPSPSNTGGSLEPWVYGDRPQQGRSSNRYSGGTARGGIMYLSPEVDMMDSNTDFAPPGITKSEFYVQCSPGTYFAAGSTRLATARPKLGYRWGIDASNDLLFERTDTWGVPFKTFKATNDGLLKFILGDSISYGNVAGKMATFLTTVNCIGGIADEALQTITIPANTLNGYSKGFKVVAWGTTAANANAKNIKLYFGTLTGLSGIINNDITLAPNFLNWKITAYVFRTFAASQRMTLDMIVGAVSQTTRSGFLTENETTDLSVRLACDAVAGGDITAHGMYIEAIT